MEKNEVTPGRRGAPRGALLNEGQENEMEIFGYKTQIARRIACIVGYIFSLGFLLLLFYWKPDWDVWANCVACSLQDADVILLRTTDEFKNYSRKKVRWVHLSTLQSASEAEQDYPIKADEHSIANRAIMKAGFKVRFIRVQKIRYVWDNVENKFTKIGALEDRYSCADIHRTFGPGLTAEEQEIRKLICGPNAIEVKIVPIWKLLIKEVLNPFYLFQAAALGLWLGLGYYEVSIAIIIMTLISVIVTVYDLRQQSVKLHELVETHNSVTVTVCLNNGDYQKVESRNLVPGDVIALMGQKLYLPCDALLVNGGCIVDEGMLTGESIPVTKMPLPTVDNAVPWKTYSGEDYKRHVLFCGTNVIQTKASDHGTGKAVVLQTGFNTAKGDLVRSILYPKPVNFKLHRDAFRFLMGLLAAGLVAMVYSIVVYAIKEQAPGDTVIMALLVITVAVPPALLAALAVGVMYAQRRLKRKGIFCISPQRINVCGQLNLVCFDKTGTLTEDGLDLWGIVPARENSFQEVHRFNSGETLPWGPLVGSLASCHSLIIADGKLQGDPMDLKMFEGTSWEAEDTSANDDDTDGESTSSMTLKPGPNASQIPVEGLSIVNQFPFSSSLQRMSVVTQVIGGNEVLAFMKGAPEKVISFCRPETVPSNFSSELQLYTAQGFRVIGLAYKALPPEMHSVLKSLTREDVESNLEFLGLLVMENQLKPETKPVLQELMDARIRTVMVTGDNLQTALTVAKHSGMISESSRAILVEASAPEEYKPASLTFTTADAKNKMDIFDEMHINIEGKCTHPLAMGNYHFAMEGKTYQVIVQHFYSLLPKLLINGVIFARMSPGLKSSLVEELQKLDYCVGMCGDGANDCGALKMAHAGISLSEQEASVASPFTSRTPNIECVTELIKEGRCALVTSFTVFKYMSLYALILLINLVLLYWQIKLLGKRQYLITDVAISTVVCLTISLNSAYPKLAPYRPPNQLMSPPLLLSIFFNTLFNFIIQVCGFVTVQHQEWYSETNIHSACLTANLSLNATAAMNFEATTLFPLTEGNLVIVAFVFSKGKPFRKPIYTNYLFLALIIGLTAVSIFLIFADIAGVYIEMELVCTPTRWRVYIFVALVVVFIASWGLEDGVIENRALWLRIKKLFNYKSSSQYRKQQRLLEQDTEWPPLNRTILPDSSITEAEAEHGTYCNAAYEKNEKEPESKEQNIPMPS